MVVGGVESSFSEKLLSSKQAFQFYWNQNIPSESENDLTQDIQDLMQKNDYNLTY